MRNKLFVGGVFLAIVFIIFQLTTTKDDSPANSGKAFVSSALAADFGSSNNATGVEVSSWGDNWSGSSPNNPTTPNNVMVGLISQRDQSQYANKDEFTRWSPSACSAAAIASVLTSFGQSVKISNILAIMQQQPGFTPQGGLSDYSQFGKVAQKYGLSATVDENQDLEAHYNSILAQLKANQPVIINVQDADFFPKGHFVVAYALNSDGTIAIMNPDPVPGKTVQQNWPSEGLKLYFSRTLRSILFTK